MVLPIQGPITRLVQGSYGSFGEYDFTRSFRQKAPFTLPLNWTRAHGKIVQGFNPPIWSPTYYGGLWEALITSAAPPIGNVSYFRRTQKAFDECYAASFGKMVAKTRKGGSASLGISLAEGRESLILIAAIARKIANSALALKRGNIPLFLQELGIAHNSKLVGTIDLAVKRKDFASAYLAVVFGLRPLVQDMRDAVEVLQSNYVPQARFRTRTSKTVVEDDVPAVYAGSFARVEVSVRLSATVSVSNPNLWLANQLGFVNPAQVAWELIPLSFLVDWFVPIGRFLGGYSAFVGLSLSDCVVTYRQQLLIGHSQAGVYSNDETGYRIERVPVPAFVVPRPQLRLPDHSGLAGKAASLVALAVQNLSFLQQKR